MYKGKVLANARVDVFEECFKLIFTKLYDEKQSGEDITTIQKWLEFNPEISLEVFKNFAGKSQEDLKLLTPNNDKEKKIIAIQQG